MDKQKLLSHIKRFQDIKILVIGDVILDAYFKGKVRRISPEAPVPIVELESKEYRLGGAANVALNVAELGADCMLCSVVGNDVHADALESLAKERGLSTHALIRSHERMTSVKTRVISSYQQMIRLDEEITTPLSEALSDKAFEHVQEAIDSYQPDAIIFEDYDKGMLSGELIQRIIALATSKNIPVSVDPKRDQFFSYKGATLFKPNLKELREGLNLPTLTTDDTALVAAFSSLIERMPVEMGFFTLSADGVFITDGTSHHRIGALPRNIADVSGAGDTVIATATCALVSGLSMDEIAYVSNLAAGWVCQFPGVVSITVDDLISEVEKQL